jgi:excisionase family DNA binding protein
MSLLTRQDAADFLGCSIRKIDMLVSSGKLRATAVGERGTRIQRDDLQAFLQGSKLCDPAAVIRSAERALGSAPDSKQLHKLIVAAGLSMRAGGKLTEPELNEFYAWLKKPGSQLAVRKAMTGAGDVSSRNYTTQLD